jgi:hypothetical protein
LAGQSGVLNDPKEQTIDHGGIERLTFPGREHQVHVVPALAYRQLLFGLADAMALEGTDGYLGKGKDASASLGLGFHQPVLSIQALESVSDRDCCVVEVHVFPAQPRDLGRRAVSLS